MGETLYKVKIKATFKINLNVAFNMSECYKKDTFIHSRNKMSSFESLTGNHTSAYYLVKRKGLLASSCFQHSFFYTYYIFDFLYFMTRILSHL